MKIVDFEHPTKGLDTFDSYLAKFTKISKGSPMPNLLAIMDVKLATHVNKELLSAWVQCEAMFETMIPNTTPLYDEYFEYMLGYAKKLEAAVTNNTTSRKENVAESNYLLPYSPSDECYNDAIELSSYMVDQGGDEDMIQDTL